MKNKRVLLIRACAVLVLVLIGAAMMLIGRGHTVYIDNKKVEFNGKTYECPYKVVVNVKGEQVAKLYEKERGKATNIGQNFTMDLKITQEKGDNEELRTVSVKLPYSMDGIVINVPAVLNGLPEEAYLNEFIIVEETPAEEEINTEGLDMSGF